MTLYAVSASIELLRENRLVTELTFKGVVAVANLLAARSAITVVRVFRGECADDEIRILVLRRVVRVLTILAIRIVDGCPRYCETQLMPLLKKRPLKIHRSPVGKRIKAIAPPHALLIGLVRRLRCIDREDRLAREIALSPIERPLIAESHAFLFATRGAEVGQRQ